MEIEMLSVVFCVMTLSHYLTNKHFTLFCDNIAVKYMLSNNHKLYRGQFSFAIKYIKSSENKVSDCLSMRPYDYDNTLADDKMEDFPYLPGIDGLNRLYAWFMPRDLI